MPGRGRSQCQILSPIPVGCDPDHTSSTSYGVHKLRDPKAARNRAAPLLGPKVFLAFGPFFRSFMPGVWRFRLPYEVRPEGGCRSARGSFFVATICCRRGRFGTSENKVIAVLNMPPFERHRLLKAAALFRQECGISARSYSFCSKKAGRMVIALRSLPRRPVWSFFPISDGVDRSPQTGCPVT